MGMTGTVPPWASGHSRHVPRERVMPGAPGKSDWVETLPVRTITLGADSSMNFRRNGKQVAFSASVGARLPGGRQ